MTDCCCAKDDFSASISSFKLEHDAVVEVEPVIKPPTHAWTGAESIFAIVPVRVEVSLSQQ